MSTSHSDFKGHQILRFENDGGLYVLWRGKRFSRATTSNIENC